MMDGAAPITGGPVQSSPLVGIGLVGMTSQAPTGRGV
ncbi:hypothetical protein RSAG8_11234, partial [Rhizoctonia solani AG-8 WAC10335]